MFRLICKVSLRTHAYVSFKLQALNIIDIDHMSCVRHMTFKASRDDSIPATVGAKNFVSSIHHFVLACVFAGKSPGAVTARHMEDVLSRTVEMHKVTEPSMRFRSPSPTRASSASVKLEQTADACCSPTKLKRRAAPEATSAPEWAVDAVADEVEVDLSDMIGFIDASHSEESQIPDVPSWVNAYTLRILTSLVEAVVTHHAFAQFPMAASIVCVSARVRLCDVMYT